MLFVERGYRGTTLSEVAKAAREDNLRQIRAFWEKLSADRLMNPTSTSNG